jgi:hypothetical protein
MKHANIPAMKKCDVVESKLEKFRYIIKSFKMHYLTLGFL